MDYQVIDNFLPKDYFKELQSKIIFSESFHFGLSSNVSNDKKPENENWNWYGNILIYRYVQLHPIFTMIAGMFMPKIEENGGVKSLIRIKANFYPWTHEVKEHLPHVDYDFSHKSALYSLNTCDGFTRMENGDKVDSVENRIVFFDGGKPHNSSTTSNAKGRFNLNFNWI